MIQFHTLGIIDLRRPGGELRSILAQPKRLALLAWLAIERPRGFQTRDRARALFWPERDDAHARRALNRAIYWLRRALGEGVLVSRGNEAVGVARGRFWTDVEAFESAVSEGRHAEAVELYRGDLLRGFFVSEADGFERWMESERQRLRSLAHEAGRALTEAEAARGNLTLAAHWARWTLERSPCDETGVRRLMSILDAAGDRAGALQAYDRFARYISAELDLPPSPETEAVVSALRARTHQIGTAGTAAGSAGIIQNAGLTIVRDAHSPVTGLSAEAPLRVPGAPLRRQTRPKARIALAAACAIMALVVAGIAVRASGRPVLDARRAVVYPFANRTGDGAFDYLGQLTSDWITHGLGEAGIVVIPQQTTTDRARSTVLSGWGNPGRTGEEARAIVIRGAIYRTGAFLHFEASVISALPRRVTWTLPSVTAPVDSPERALGEIRDRATGASAALLNPRFASWLPLGTATPPTFDAFKEFARGDELMLSGRAHDALSLFRRATELDTTFVWPRLQIAAVYLNLLDTEGAESVADSLDRMHERLTPLESSWLAWIQAVIHENNEEADRAMTRAATIAPDRFLFLHAEVLRWLNRPAAIVKLLRHAGPGSPYHDGASYWVRLADAYHQLGQHRRELAVAVRIRRHQPSDRQALGLEIRALAALHRTNQIMARLKLAESLPGRPSLGRLMRETAEEVRAHGDAETAATILDRTIGWYYGLPPEEAARVNNRFDVARALHLRGRLDDAEQFFQELAADNPNELPEYEGALGMIAARRGDRAAAQALVSKLEQQRLAMDPLPKYSLFAQARIVAQLDDPERAVRLLREAVGRQGMDLHMDADFGPLANDSGFVAFIRPKG